MNYTADQRDELNLVLADAFAYFDWPKHMNDEIEKRNTIKQC